MGTKCLVLPIRLGSKSGHNGCNVYDANDEFVCSLILPLHQTIEQIRADAETRPETKKNLEIADSIVTAVNVMPEVITTLRAIAEGQIKNPLRMKVLELRAAQILKELEGIDG